MSCKRTYIETSKNNRTVAKEIKCETESQVMCTLYMAAVILVCSRYVQWYMWIIYFSILTQCVSRCELTTTLKDDLTNATFVKTLNFFRHAHSVNYQLQDATFC